MTYWPMTKKLKTNGEVIAAIKRGFPKGIKYDQSRYYNTRDVSEQHPCGTSYCIFGAIAVNYGGIHTQIRQMQELVIDQKILSKWQEVFYPSVSKAAFANMKEFLTEKQCKEITTFLIERMK